MNASEIFTLARYVNAVNTFLVFFKVVLYMKMVPAFALVMGTMSRAAKRVVGFMVVFGVVMMAFVGLFTISFGSDLESYVCLGLFDTGRCGGEGAAGGCSCRWRKEEGGRRVGVAVDGGCTTGASEDTSRPTERAHDAHTL